MQSSGANQSSQISRAVQNLLKNGLSNSPHSHLYPDFQHIDVYPQMRRFFTQKAATVLHIKLSGLIHQRNEAVGPVSVTELLAKLQIRSAKTALDSGRIAYKRVCDLVLNFGSTCSYGEIHEAMNMVITTINHLAEKGYITAALSPLSIIELSESVPLETRYVVVSYVAITAAGQAYVEKNLPNMSFKESEVPPLLKDQK